MSEGPGSQAFPSSFPHQRLALWGQTLGAVQQARQIADSVPRGFRPFADQLLRAAGSVALNLCEGANARTAGEKRNSFGIARKEAGEAAGAAEVLATLGLVDPQQVGAFIQRLDAIAAQLSALIRRLDGAGRGH